MVDREFWTLRPFPMIRAVRASASFPGLLPAACIRLRRVADMDPVAVQRGRNEPAQPPSDRPRPRRFALLADGGVYNNIGTHWSDGGGRLADHDGVAMPRRLRREVDEHLVVDAGVTPHRFSALVLAVPLVGIPLRAWRVMMSSYAAALSEQRNRALVTTWENDGGRRTSARVIGVGERPGWGQYSRPEGMELTNNAWRVIAWTSEGCGTHLWRIGRRHSIRMVAHGYALAVEALVGVGIRRNALGQTWLEWLETEVKASLPARVWDDRPLSKREWQAWRRSRR